MDSAISINLDNNISINPHFTHRMDPDINLDATIFVYHDGRKWKYLPYQFVTMYPVIQDKYYETTKPGKNKVIDMTISICPFSLYATIYYEKYKPANLILKNNIVLQNKNYYLSPILNIYFNKDNRQLANINPLRGEVKVMTLRNALSKYPDSVMIDMKKTSIIDPLVSKEYCENNNILFGEVTYPKIYHPKTLTYIIEYLSNDIDSSDPYKYSILVSKDSQPKNSNCINIDENGISKYLEKMLDKIREKGGLLVPCYWFAWMDSNEKLGRETKVIKL